MGWTNTILPVEGANEVLGRRTLVPWFHENVGTSAWGVATHKDPMLFELSSNIKDIHVLKPTLSPEGRGLFHKPIRIRKRLSVLRLGSMAAILLFKTGLLVERSYKGDVAMGAGARFHR